MVSLLTGVMNGAKNTSASTSTAKDSTTAKKHTLDALPKNAKDFASRNQVLRAELTKATELENLLKQKKDLESDIQENLKKIRAEQPNMNDIYLLDSIVNKCLHDPNLYDSLQFIAFISKTTSFDQSDPEAFIETIKTALNHINEAVAAIQLDILQLGTISTAIKALDKNNQYNFSTELDSLTHNINTLQEIYSPDAERSLLINATGTVANYTMLASCGFSILPKKITQITSDKISISDSLRTPDGSVITGWGPFDVYSYGGKRINVSVGFAVSFGNLNATDYAIIRDSTGKAIGLNSSRENSIGNFSPILLVNWVFKCKGAISPAVSVGLNPDFSSLSNSRLLIGGSISFSQSNDILKRFLLSGGIGMGMTQALNPKYENITDYSTLTNLTETNLTENTFRVGGFFAVSFNL